MNELGKTMQDSIGTDRKGLMNVRNYRETIGKIIFSNRSSCQVKTWSKEVGSLENYSKASTKPIFRACIRFGFINKKSEVE